MVTNDITVTVSGKAPVLRKSNGLARSTEAKIVAAGLALIREHLDDDIVQHFKVAADCIAAVGLRSDVRWLDRIGDLRAPAEWVADGKGFYRSALPRPGASLTPPLFCINCGVRANTTRSVDVVG
jgi:hypothetical protein